METVLAFLTEYTEEFGAVGGIIALLLLVWAIVKWPFQKAQKVDLPPETVDKIAPRETGKLSVVEFIKIRREMKADLEVELAAAHEDEKAQFRARIAELESDIANPDAALAEAENTIATLKDRLERMGNEIGGARLAEARAALERLDFSVADEIFAEVEARQELAVQEAARAAFGRGEVAEAEVRWADAAAHYARAARLEPDFSTLRKASEFAWRSGDYAGASAQSAALVKFCEDEGTQEQLSDALNEQAVNCYSRGDLAEAERLYREALEIGKATIGEAHPNYAIGLNNLAEVLRARGDLAEAERLFRQALEIGKATIGEAHPAYATRLNNLALVLQARGDLAEAERLFRQALEIYKATIGEAHPDYATWLNNLAGVLQARGDLAEAEQLFRQALEIGKATIGEAHPAYATRLNNLASVLRARGDLAEAERLLRQALEIGKATIGEAHPDYATRLNNLALVLQARGDLAEAERLFREALEIDRAALGEAHPQYASHAINLAGLLAETGRREEAGPLFEEGLRIREAALGAAHPDTVKAREHLEAFRKAEAGKTEE